MITNPTTSYKNVLVTGATGILGIPLCRKLSVLGVNTTAFARTGGVFTFPENCNFVQGDILNFPALASTAMGSDVIFHLAAAVHGSATSDQEFEDMNVRGTENVIKAADDIGAKLVHVSTVNVVGFQNGSLTDAYSETKTRAEIMIHEAVADGLEAVIVRPATVFGTQFGKSGMIVDRLLAGSLRVLPAPSRKISPVWSDDLADALISAATVDGKGQIYTVAGPVLKTAEFIRLICDHGSLGPPIVSIPTWAVIWSLRIASWLRVITRWEPPISVETVRNGSIHDGKEAASDLGFSYTPISEIFPDHVKHFDA